MVLNKIIEIKNVYKSFGEKVVHQGIDLDIFEGEKITVLGGSGTGKSVLLKLIIGLFLPDSGQIKVMGKEITRIDEEELVSIRKNIGMLFQGAALFDSLTVWGNIAYALIENSDMSDNEINNVVKKKLELVGLQGIEDKMPADLSGGMKKRVGLARALATTPKILLYDEPTTGLDPPNINRINDLINDMNRQFNITSVIITHDLESAFAVSDRIAFLHDGKIVFVGTVEEANNSDCPMLDDFIKGVMREEISAA
ncbi:MAG: ABC transporter ATP-binding protein [Thermodesulfobacteriota bacterium]